MGRLLRPTAVGVFLAMIALTGHAQNQPRQSESQNPPAEQGAAGQPPAGQAPPPGQGANPVFRAGIDFVRVDVIASDRSGNAIMDLKQSDFEITEDGKPQTVQTFKMIKLDGGATPGPDGPPRAIRNDADEETEAAKDDVRLFAVFLDDYHVKEGSSLSARAAISKWVETQLGPSDMIGVMRPLESIEQVRMTRNHSAIARAVQQFRGRKGDYTPQNEIEQNYAYYPAETVEQIRNQVSLSAIKSLIVHMGGLKEGRKALVLVSEGYSNTLPSSLRSPNAQFSGAAGGGTATDVNDPNEQRYQFFAGQDLEFYMQGVYEVANQYNVSIYAVDPRGLPVFEFDIDKPVDPGTDRQFLAASQNTLRALALETDGRAILNRNDLDVGMKQIIRDSSAYYLIGYTTAQAKSDGKFHAINVKVKRPGVSLRSRKGYWALTPAAAEASVVSSRKPAAPPAVEAALTSLATAVQPKSSRLVRTWIGTSRGENGKTRVTFVWEQAPKAPGDRPTSASDLPARILVTAVMPDGSPAFRGRVPERVSSSPPSDSAAAAALGPSRATFELNPGKVQLRFSVEGPASQVLDSEIREFTVPDLTVPQVIIGTPEVFRARALRDFQQMKTDLNAVPVATREFSRTERVMIRVAAYAPGTAKAAVTAKLLSRTGAPMSDLVVAPVPAADASYQMDLPLNGLAPGEYVVEIGAAAEGGGEAKELVGFRLTS